jgi:NADPH2:quinone reductase
MTAKARVVRFAAPGGPEVLRLETVDLSDPGAGEVQLRQTAIGLNFQEIYQRSGVYKMPLPSGLGNEAAGVVEKVGAGVSGLKEGDRVCYGGGDPGSYADRRNVPAVRVIRTPEGVSDEIAAAVLFKGMTVEYLLNRCYPVKAGQAVLFYAAAGGVGLLAGQWGKHLGANVIGVAGNAEKCRLALANGYASAIDRSREDIAVRVKELTGGAGVPVAYDSVGKATFGTTIRCLAPRGYFVSFGAISGAPPAVEANLLRMSGSLYFTRPALVTYTGKREDFEASAGAVFELLAKGVLKANINARYTLADAARAHTDLEGGRTTGSSVLIP